MRFFVLWALWQGLAGTAWAEEGLNLRRQYNQVVASIDTLVRFYGDDRLNDLVERHSEASNLPRDNKLVLIFWADDEAELFLNGYRVGDTRLTPTTVEIPAFYLRESNILYAHCWDTDRVESGFMAGLYLRDSGGQLRKVLVTDEENWWVAGERAEVRFYNHTQPDIPDAEVIWGAGLYGEVKLEARFDAVQLGQASKSRPLRARSPKSTQQPMETHLVVSRLVQLQKQRDDLARRLANRRSPVRDVRYQGFIRGRLAFTLGRAGPLAEMRSITTSENLLEWVEALPITDRELVFRERRELKGVSQATQARSYDGGKGGEADRRVDYLPPPERGPVYGEGGATGQGRGAAPISVVLVGRQGRWDLWLSSIGLLLYLGAAGRQWWKIFRAKVWLS